MIINKASKCRLYPNKEQQTVINKTLGSCRYIYNKMLERQIKMYKRRGDHLSCNEMQNLLPAIKKYLPWLAEADSQALKYACRQLDTAYNKFFKGSAGFPKYKKRRNRQSYTTTSAKSIHIERTGKRKGKVKLPIIGWVRIRGLNLPDDFTITKATVSRDPDGKYYVSIAYKTDIEVNFTFTDTPTVKGMDFREGDLYCDDEGKSAGKPNNIMESMALLKRAQDTLSRTIESHITGYRVIGKKRYPIYDRKLSICKNIEKQRERIARIHKRIANQRKDFLHKQSTAIAKQYDIICTEDFKVQSMLLKKGNDDSAIKRHNINRKIYDDGWFMFTQMLKYKTMNEGKHFIKVGKDYPSTTTCHCCGRMEPSVSDLTVRKWTCLNCGVHHDRDHNAAINIKNEGLRLLGVA